MQHRKPARYIRSHDTERCSRPLRHIPVNDTTHKRENTRKVSVVNDTNSKENCQERLRSRYNKWKILVTSVLLVNDNTEKAKNVSYA